MIFNIVVIKEWNICICSFLRCLNIDILILLGIMFWLFFCEFRRLFKFWEVIFFILLGLIFGFFKFMDVKLLLFEFFGGVILVINY